MNSTSERPSFYFFLCLFSLLFFGLLSLFFGKELCWDLANYHFYNPYAFLTHREDYWPTSFIHQYLNPTLDFLSYFLIVTFSPLTTTFLMGALHGLNFFVLFLIARTFQCEKYISFIIALLGMLGANVINGIGSFQQDNFIALFVLFSIYLQLKTIHSIHHYRWSNFLLIFSGLILGMGIGLKLTTGMYLVGYLLTTVCLPLPFSSNIKWIATLGLSSLLGLFITSGYWMLFLFSTHHNPFFPFFNAIFHSPDFDFINWHDTRFFPTHLIEALLFPFYFGLSGQTVERPFQDFRFALFYLFIGFLVIQWIITRLKKKSFFISPSNRWIISFSLFTFILWECLFSNSRYLVALEMLVPLLLWLILHLLTKNKRFINLCALILSLFLLWTTIPSEPVRMLSYKGTFFNVELPKTLSQTPTATVLITYSPFALSLNPRPHSYLIPFFPKTWHFIGIPFQENNYAFDPVTDHALKKRIQKELQHSRSLFLLTDEPYMSAFQKTAKHFGANGIKTCYPIQSDRIAIAHQSVLLCELKMTSYNTASKRS